MKKISILLCIAILLGVFGLASCNKSQSDQNIESSAETTEKPVERVKLIENGKALYTVVYPNDCSNEVLTSMKNLVKQIKKVTGVELPTKSDYLRPGQEKDPNAKELLFGRVNYDETREQLFDLTATEYIMKVQDAKLFILAPNDEYLVKAAEYYGNNLIEKNLEGEKGNFTLYFEEYRYIEEDTNDISAFNGISLVNYTIVYESERTGYQAVAERLRDKIAAASGFNLPIKKDTQQKEGDYEILIGKTNRQLSQMHYAEFVDLLTYKVVIEEGKIQIVSGGAFSARYCVDRMVVELFGSDVEHYDNGEYPERDLKTDITDVPKLTQANDLRIMSYNIMAERWADFWGASTPTTVQRAEILAAVLSLYQPDVIGMQEVDAPWIPHLTYYVNVLKEQYGIEYTLAMTTHEGKPNFNAILYRSDKMTAEAQGIEVTSWWESTSVYHMRNATWMKFKMGEKYFILVNGHYCNTNQEKNIQDLREKAELVNSLIDEYHVPVFCTGDFNSMLDSPQMEVFLAEAPLEHLLLQAKELGVLINENSGIGNVGLNRITSDNYIDFVIGYGNYTVKRYETVLSCMTKYASDHSPMVADVTLN